MSGKESLDRFCDDYLEEVLSYLTLKDRFRFECISKQWQRVVYKRQTAIIGNNIKSLSEDNWRGFETILKKCTNVSNIGFYYNCRSEDTAIDLMVKHCSQLTRIHDIDFKSSTAEAMEKLFTKFGPQLPLLYVSFDESLDQKLIKKCLEMCVNLRSFDAFSEAIPLLTLQSVTESQLPFKRLNHIVLRLYNTALNTHTLDVFADRFGHQMKKMVLEGFWMEEHELAEALNKLMVCLPRMRALVELILDLKLVSTQELIPLLKQIGINCRHLKSLDIKVDEWTPELIHTITKHFKALKRLYLSGFKEVTEMAITSHSLAPLKRLTHLRLWYDNRKLYFTDTLFTNIGHNLPHLQYLDVRYVKISDESLVSLSALRQIRKIRITRMVEERDNDLGESVNNHIANCPKLCLVNLV